MTTHHRDTTVDHGATTSGWGNLHHQQVFSYYTIDPDAVTAGRNVYVLEEAKSIAPVDGDLPQDGTAELVSLDITICKAYVAPTANEGPNPGLVMLEAELSFDPTSAIEAAMKEHIDTIGDAAFTTDSDYGDRVNPGADIHVREAQSCNSDVIWFGESRNYTPFKDPETGAGGGPTAEGSSTRHFRNFRREYGRGPIVDADDRLHEHLFINVGTEDNPVVNQAFGGILGYTLVWDVLDNHE